MKGKGNIALVLEGMFIPSRVKRDLIPYGSILYAGGIKGSIIDARTLQF